MENSRKHEKIEHSNPLLKTLQQVVQPLLTQNTHLCVGYSGGLDSSVLLHLLHHLSQSLAFRLSAIHVNHHLHSDALRWQQFCAAQCAALGVRFVVEDVFPVPRAGESLENLARGARYQAFARQSCDYIVLAHHQQDQAETVLIQLLRGAGVAGLSAMAMLHPMGGRSSGPPVLRPLLHTPRAQLRQYAAQCELTWVEDPSNAQYQHVRNFLRHAVAPLLEQRFPSWASTLSRSAQHLSQAADLLEELALQDLSACAGPWGLVIERVMALSRPRGFNLLRTWFRVLGAPACHAAQLETWFSQARAAPGRLPLLRWGGWELVRHQDQWMLHPVVSTTWLAQPVESWRKTSFLNISGAGILSWRDFSGAFVMGHEIIPAQGPQGRSAPLREAGLRIHPLASALLQGQSTGLTFGRELTRLCPDVLDRTPLHVRRRLGGEALQVSVGGPTRTLRHLFQEAGLPVWWRNSVPLLYCGEQLIAVPGLAVAASYRADPKQPAVELLWQPASSCALQEA